MTSPLMAGILFAMCLSAQRRRAMIVEDECLVRDLMGDALSADPDADWEVEAFECAEAARCALDSGGDWDVVSVDVLLPGMSGVELVEWMRGKGVSIPVVVVSGMSDALTILRCLEMGADTLADFFRNKHLL